MKALINWFKGLFRLYYPIRKLYRDTHKSIPVKVFRKIVKEIHKSSGVEFSVVNNCLGDTPIKVNKDNIGSVGEMTQFDFTTVSLQIESKNDGNVKKFTFTLTDPQSSKPNKLIVDVSNPTAKLDRFVFSYNLIKEYKEQHLEYVNIDWFTKRFLGYY